MLVIEIAAGIILAVVVLLNWRSILAVGGVICAVALGIAVFFDSPWDALGLAALISFVVFVVRWRMHREEMELLDSVQQVDAAGSLPLPKSSSAEVHVGSLRGLRSYTHER